MPLQNRVTPEGEIVAVPERGTMYGNRGGCFHRPDRTLLTRRYATRQWICCVLEFKGRRRPLMRPGLFTELFFLDEATAMAAGHRPCFECRRVDAVRFAEIWNGVGRREGRATAPDMDVVLHGERIDASGRKISYETRLGEVPDGAFVRWRGQCGLVHGGRVRPWSFAGYSGAAEVDGNSIVQVLTPRSTVAILRAGYQPMLHPSLAGC